jgi:hypothetical protein
MVVRFGILSLHCDAHVRSRVEQVEIKGINPFSEGEIR